MYSEHVSTYVNQLQINLSNDDLVYVLTDYPLVDEQNFPIVLNDVVEIHQDDLDFHYLNKNIKKIIRNKENFLPFITSASRNVCKSSTICV